MFRKGLQPSYSLICSRSKPFRPKEQLLSAEGALFLITESKWVVDTRTHTIDVFFHNTVHRKVYVKLHSLNHKMVHKMVHEMSHVKVHVMLT